MCHRKRREAVGVPGDTSITIRAIKPSANPDNPGASDKLEYEVTLQGSSLGGTPVFVHCGDKTDVAVLGGALDFTAPQKVCVGHEATFTVSFRPRSEDVVLTVDSCSPDGYVILNAATRDNASGTITATVKGPPANEIPEDGKVSFTIKSSVVIEGAPHEVTKDGETTVNTVDGIEMETQSATLCLGEVDGFEVKAHALCDGQEYTAGTLGLPTMGIEVDFGGTGVTLHNDGYGNLALVAQADLGCGCITIKAYIEQSENVEFIAAGTGRLETAEITLTVQKIDELVLEADKTSASYGETAAFTATGKCKGAVVGTDPDPGLADTTYAIVSGGNLGTLDGNVLTITSPLPGTIQVQATWTWPDSRDSRDINEWRFLSRPKARASFCR